MTTLVIDTGLPRVVGVFSVEENEYVLYRDDDVATAIQRIKNADEVVTFNGTDTGDAHNDLAVLGAFVGIEGELPLKGVHTDMLPIYWSDSYFGCGLKDIYSRLFGADHRFPIEPDDGNDADTYIMGNRLDVLMTFKLWERWKQKS